MSFRLNQATAVYQAKLFGEFIEAIAKPRPRKLALCHLDGRSFCEGYRGEHGVNWRNQWEWIANAVAEQFELDAWERSRLNSEETEDCDFVTLDGKRLAQVVDA